MNDLGVDMKPLSVNEIIEESHTNAVAKGWWSQDRPVLECLMLVVSEVAEACESYREDGMTEEKFLYLDENGKPCGIASELADVYIRIADLCGHYHIDLAKAIETKLDYNRTRPYRHGNKLA